VPLPFLDVYGKIGAAHLESAIDSYFAPACAPGGPCSNVIAAFHSSRQTTTLAYGAGAQFKFSNLGIRLDCERVSLDTDDPQMLTVGATWTFRRRLDRPLAATTSARMPGGVPYCHVFCGRRTAECLCIFPSSRHRPTIVVYSMQPQGKVGSVTSWRGTERQQAVRTGGQPCPVDCARRIRITCSHF
jgi:hypothetical protein